MNIRNRYLTGILLILIGALIGGLVVIFQQGGFISDRANVKFTEVKKSEAPLFSEKELDKMGDRFLFKEVARHVTPTVVYISSVVRLDDRDGGDRSDDEHRHFWDRFRSRRARTVGSGVVISKDGYIVTNNHVIEGAVEGGIVIILNDKRVFKARIVGTDPTTDLAILKIDADDLPAITIGNSDKVEVGQWVLAIGNPFRLRSTVTAGIVSALSRQVQVAKGMESQLNIASYIQTDAAINKGNSGGPLVNTSGELIGINTAIASQTGSYQGYGFAVPSNLVGKVMHDLIQFGEVHRAMLGVSILGIDYLRAQDLGLDRIRGVEITALTENGAARRSGLKQNDVILKVNGQEVNEANELQEKIAVHEPGEKVQLTIWRDNKVLEKPIILGHADAALLTGNRRETSPEEPDDAQEENRRRGVEFGSFSLGFKVMALATPQDPDIFDLIIARVFPSSEAAGQGVKKGSVIKKVDGNSVKDLEQLRNEITKALDHAGAVTLKVETPEGATGFYRLKE